MLIVAGYDRGAFRILMRTGRAPGGRETVSMLRIAGGSLSHLSDDETDAIYDYLVARWRALTAKQNSIRDR